MCGTPSSPLRPFLALGVPPVCHSPIFSLFALILCLLLASRLYNSCRHPPTLPVLCGSVLCSSLRPRPTHQSHLQALFLCRDCLISPFSQAHPPCSVIRLVLFEFRPST